MVKVKKKPVRYNHNRKLKMYAVELEYDDAKCNIANYTDLKVMKKEVKQHLKKAYAYIRSHCKNRGWACAGWFVASIADPDTGEKVRIHIHGIMTANPGFTLATLLCGKKEKGKLVEEGYWTKRYGNITKRSSEFNTSLYGLASVNY